jgi:hypothetical protein
MRESTIYGEITPRRVLRDEFHPRFTTVHVAEGSKPQSSNLDTKSFSANNSGDVEGKYSLV